MIRLFLPLFLLFTHLSYGEIIPIDSIEELTIPSKEWNEQTLVVFDIDDTLTTPSNPASQIPNILDNLDFFKEMTNSLTPLEQDLAYSFSAVSSGSQLIESVTPDFVASLQDRHIPTIALTSIHGGLLDEIEDIYAWRNDQLTKNNISFEDGKEKIVLYTLTPVFGCYPSIVHGILISSHHNKGSVLRAYLKTTNQTPKKIILVDNQKKNLTIVENVLNQLEIPFTGYYYKGAQYLDADPIDRETFEEIWNSWAAKAKAYMDGEMHICQTNL